MGALRYGFGGVHYVDVILGMFRILICGVALIKNDILKGLV